MNRNCLPYRDQWINEDTGREYKADILVDPSAKLYALMVDSRRVGLTDKERAVKRAAIRTAWEGVIERVEILAAAETERAREPRIQFLKKREAQGEYTLEMGSGRDHQRLEMPSVPYELHEYQKDALKLFGGWPKKQIVILGDYYSYSFMDSHSLFAKLRESDAYKKLNESFNGGCGCALCKLEKSDPKNVLMSAGGGRIMSMPKETYDKIHKLAMRSSIYSTQPRVVQPKPKLETTTFEKLSPKPAPKKHERMSALQKTLLGAYLKPTE